MLKRLAHVLSFRSVSLSGCRTTQMKEKEARLCRRSRGHTGGAGAPSERELLGGCGRTRRLKTDRWSHADICAATNNSGDGSECVGGVKRLSAARMCARYDATLGKLLFFLKDLQTADHSETPLIDG